MSFQITINITELFMHLSLHLEFLHVALQYYYGGYTRVWLYVVVKTSMMLKVIKIYISTFVYMYITIYCTTKDSRGKLWRFLQFLANVLYHTVHTREYVWTTLYVTRHEKTRLMYTKYTYSTATRPLSELFTRSTNLKLANALSKPTLKLSLSYY